MCAMCTNAVGAEIIDLSIRPPFPTFFFFFFSDLDFLTLLLESLEEAFLANVFASPLSAKIKAIMHSSPAKE